MIEQLKNLKKKIIAECGRDKVWFFCEDDDTNTIASLHMKGRGWFGISPIFLFPSPSQKNITKGEPKNQKLINFYNLLKELGLQDAHLTDLIKIRLAGSSFGRATEANNALLDFEDFMNSGFRAARCEKVNYAKQKEYLIQEFEILNKNTLSPIVIMSWPPSDFDRIARLFIKKYLPQYKNHQNLITNIYHYSYAYRFGKVRRFGDQLKNISKII